jgi:heme exporter protein B
VWRWLSEVWAVTAKDLRTEFRTRVALARSICADVLIAVVHHGTVRIASDRPFLLAALLWIVLFFAAMAGLDRSFVKEEESHTAPLLRLAAAPSVVWAGKLLFNLVLLAVLLAAVVRAYCILMGYPRSGLVPALLAAGGFTWPW